MKKHKYTFFYSFLLVFLSVGYVHAQVGVLTNIGDLTLGSSAIYEVELKDLSGPGSGNDNIEISSNLNLNGTLDLVLSGYSPVISDDFVIMSYGGTLTGTFSTINWPADMIAQGWTIDYGIINPNTITIYVPSSLPVELLSFQVMAQGDAHLIRWETATEINNDFFEVEHSTNGHDFAILDKVYSRGNSTQSQYYATEHQEVKNGSHYYRLRQVDQDGTYTYSDIISIYKSMDDALSFYPNPSSGTISFDNEIDGVVVYDLLGKKVLEINSSQNTFDLSSLSAGTFFIQELNNPQTTERLIIEK